MELAQRLQTIDAAAADDARQQYAGFLLQEKPLSEAQLRELRKVMAVLRRSAADVERDKQTIERFRIFQGHVKDSRYARTEADAARAEIPGLMKEYQDFMAEWGHRRQAADARAQDAAARESTAVTAMGEMHQLVQANHDLLASEHVPTFEELMAMATEVPGAAAATPEPGDAAK